MLLLSARTIDHLKESRFVAALFVGIGLCLSCGWSACSSHGPVAYEEAEQEWREGDLALRCGWSKESRLIVAKGHSSYSHIGLLHYDSVAGWTVVHAVPDEDRPEYLKTEPVSVFWSAERAQLGAWMRIDCPDSVAAQAVQYALGKVADKVLFDNAFLLQDTTRIYCTELVWLSYLSQGLDVTLGGRQQVPTMICKEGECIFPINIEQSETTLFIKPLN